MGLLSDALRWINPPRTNPCRERYELAVPELVCDLHHHPHPGLLHRDTAQGVLWVPILIEETGVDW